MHRCGNPPLGLQVCVPALRICGNVIAGRDEWSRSILQGEVGASFASILSWSLKTGAGALTMEALWVLGNLCLLRDPELTPILGQLAERGALCAAMDIVVGEVAGFWATASMEREATLAIRNLAMNDAAPQSLLVHLVGLWGGADYKDGSLLTMVAR
eukprot:scaffold3340_cov255-Pinguiococcus_pyrenoidosus.AAC.9